ncbi:hypothetical protein [Modestobacter roseus]|uniref:hypothetical protein n=1 Tax=Modestobacter roseus TaxID=1181884 RepID=UPI0034DE8EB8
MWASVVFGVLVVLFFRAMGRAGAPAPEQPEPGWPAALHRLLADVTRGVRVFAALATAHRERSGRAGWTAGPDGATVPVVCRDDR